MYSEEFPGLQPGYEAKGIMHQSCHMTISVNMSSDCDSPSDQQTVITPCKEGFPPPPVVQGRALTAEDGREVLLLHLFFLKQTKKRKVKRLLEPTYRAGMPDFFDKKKVIQRYYIRHPKKKAKKLK
ncbi:hypothetical protein SK128_023035, partial [Halocaridina rubra]